MDMGLTGKVALITGASQGIGKACAQALAKEGCSVVICARRKETLEKAVEEIKTEGTQVLGIQADVAKVSDITNLVAKTIEKFGRIDILVNNAGFFPIKMFEEMSQEEWQQVIDINLTGTFLVSKAVYGHMADEGHGKIINVTSAAGRLGGAGLVHYSAAKAGVIGFTRALAREGAQAGIQVNAIAPGIIETDTAMHTFPGFALKEYLKSVPLGRLGKDEDVVGLLIFLCSEQSGYITGQTFAIDGGYTMV
jgi:NAD(P)-dependent dehydrogenase (short-subunit alcohol dehydrogenase family)